MKNANNNDRDEQVRQLLDQLVAYAREQNLSNRELAIQLGMPYKTLSKWQSFTLGKEVRTPSKAYLSRIREFLLEKARPEVYAKAKEAKLRAEKIKYLLLLLEDELGWFRDGDGAAREEFRRELDASDIGYISSLLTMLTEEEKFNRWRALTTAGFRHFKRR